MQKSLSRWWCCIRCNTPSHFPTPDLPRPTPHTSWDLDPHQYLSRVKSVFSSSVQFSSRWYLCAWKSPYVLYPLSGFPNVAFETVPMFIWLMTITPAFEIPAGVAPWAHLSEGKWLSRQTGRQSSPHRWFASCSSHQPATALKELRVKGSLIFLMSSVSTESFCRRQFPNGHGENLTLRASLLWNSTLAICDATS